MNTVNCVFLVMVYHTNDKPYISAVFSDYVKACSYAVEMTAEEVYDYYYAVEQWEVRDV
jgi:hypothetical protein